jgi:hypothetical protein
MPKSPLRFLNAWKKFGCRSRPVHAKSEIQTRFHPEYAEQHASDPPQRIEFVIVVHSPSGLRAQREAGPSNECGAAPKSVASRMWSVFPWRINAVEINLRNRFAPPRIDRPCHCFPAVHRERPRNCGRRGLAFESRPTTIRPRRWGDPKALNRVELPQSNKACQHPDPSNSPTNQFAL